MGQAAELHALGGFLVQVRGFFRVVGIDGDDHAAAGHQRSVVRNRIVGFDFVSPPIGKSGCTDASRGQFIGDFVAFQNMLKRADLKTELLCNAQEHEDFIFAVAVRVNVALAFQHLDERLEAQVAARRDEILLAGSGTLVVVIPVFFVVTRFAERAANGLFHPHARGGISPGLTRDAKVRTFGVFAKGELDAGHRAFKRKLCRGLAPAQLDDQRLTADGIGRAVKNIRGGDSARQITVNVDILGIEDFRHVHNRRDGNAAFINAFRGDVRVAIDNPGNDELSRGIDHLSVFRRLNALADFGDFAILNKDGAVFDRPMGNG